MIKTTACKIMIQNSSNQILYGSYLRTFFNIRTKTKVAPPHSNTLYRLCLLLKSI